MRIAATFVTLVALAANGLSPASARSEDAGLDAFGIHIADTMDRSRLHLDAVAAAGEASELVAMERPLAEVTAIYDAELEWLEENPPGECYRQLHDDYRRVLEANQSALSLMGQGVAGNDAGLLLQGSEALDVADGLLKGAVTSKVEQVALDCLEEPPILSAVGSESPMPLEWESSKTLEEVSAICIVAFQNAAEESDPDLTLPIKACASLDEWVTASAAYPAALSGSEPLQVVVEMCSDEARGLAPYTLCYGVRSALLAQSADLATGEAQVDDVPVGPASLESAAQAYLAAAEANRAAWDPIDTLWDATGDDARKRAAVWAAYAAQNEAFIDSVTTLDLPPSVQPQVDDLISRTRLVVNLERMLVADPRDSQGYARWQAAREARHEAAMEVRRVLGLPQVRTESAGTTLETPRPTAPSAAPKPAGVSVNLVFRGSGFKQRVKGYVPESGLTWCERGNKPGSRKVNYVNWVVFDGRDLEAPRLTGFSFRDPDGPGRMGGRVFFDVATDLETQYYAWSPVLADELLSRGTAKYRNSGNTVVLNVRAKDLVGSGDMTIKGEITCRPQVAS